MLDIKVIRENPERVKAAVKSRNGNLDAEVDELIAIDAERRALQQENDKLKQQQNEASKQIPQIKKAGGDASEIFAKMGEIKTQVKANDEKLASLADRQKQIVLGIPNIPDESVPIGKDDTENVEIRRWGEPKDFGFEPKAHWDLGADLGILDPETAAKVTGTRFHFYKGAGARLERSVINYYLNTHTEHGYTEVFPPFLVNRASMTGTGQLPKFEEDAFKTTDDLFLIPTAEVPSPTCSVMTSSTATNCPTSLPPTPPASVPKPVPPVAIPVASFVSTSSTRSSSSSLPVLRTPSRNSSL